MALQTEVLTREFEYNGKKLPDIGGDLPPEKVIEYYSNVHPELINATFEGPTIKDDKLHFKIVHTAGTKG